MVMLVWHNNDSKKIDEFQNEEHGLNLYRNECGLWGLYHLKNGVCQTLCLDKSFDFCLGYANGFIDRNGGTDGAFYFNGHSN